MIANTLRAPVAQLDRAIGFEPIGRGFESLRARQTNFRIQSLGESSAAVPTPSHSPANGLKVCASRTSQDLLAVPYKLSLFTR